MVITQNRHKLTLFLTPILLFGFLAVSALMYHASKQSTHETIVINGLPLAGDSKIAKIQ